MSQGFSSKESLTFLFSTGLLIDKNICVGKNVHATIPKGNMGYDQYTVPETLAVEFTFVVFLYFILLGLNLPGGGREIGCND